jgi:copper chaperone CopZ
MQKTTLSTVGSIVTALVASLCCIGPVLLAFAGAASIKFFSHFEAYRPYFIGLTAILLGSAFYLTYRKREVVCEDGTCQIKSAGKWNKIVVWLATVIAVVAIAFPYFGNRTSASANPSVKSEATAILSIKGMDCPSCANGVEGMLASIKGVQQAKVDFDKGTAVLHYDPNVVTPEVFVERVNETSYDASLVQIKKGE